MSSLEKAFATYNEKRPTAFVVKVKRNENGELDELIQLTLFLDSSYSSPPAIQRIKHYISKEFILHTCPICKNPLAFREKPNPGYLKTCGSSECHKKQNSQATKEGIISKYGVENISQTKQWSEKVKQTNLERRGVEWNTQADTCIKKRKERWKECKEEILKKRKRTNLEKYGTEFANQNPEINNKLRSSMNSYRFRVERVEKYKDTCVEKYGKYYSATEEFKQKTKEHYLKNYGVSHNSQIAEVLDKRWTNTTAKKYTFPSGREEMVQGYEPYAIDELLQSGVHEEDIVVGNAKIEKYIGKIIYVDDNGKEHRYFPDIYVISENKVIEVKSKYTLSKDIWINRKREETIRVGFAYEMKLLCNA
jgi:hypothetical protein